METVQRWWGAHAAQGVADGRARFASEMIANRAQVVLLMEGSNDISTGDPAAIGPTIENLNAMITFAVGRGIRTFLATVPPIVGLPSFRGPGPKWGSLFDVN
jgi:lysophospholipase L1-like esterase